MWSGYLVLPWSTFPAALPKIPYVGFSPVRLQAPGTTQFSSESSRSAQWLKPDSCIRHFPSRFAHAFSTTPARRDTRLCVRGLGVQRCHLGPEVLARAGLCCPCLHRLPTSSANLVPSDPLPSRAGYRAGLWHSRILLPGFQTFRAFTARLSRIAAFNFRRETQRVLFPISSASALVIE
jgi:hypothetical protein